MRWTKFTGDVAGTSYHSMEPNGYVIDLQPTRHTAPYKDPKHGRPFDLVRISTSPHGVDKVKVLGSFAKLEEAKAYAQRDAKRATRKR